MILTTMRDYQPTGTQLWRETAHIGQSMTKADDSCVSLCKSRFVVGSHNARATLHCQYRYPSPRRSGPYFRARLTPLFALPLGVFRRCVRTVQKTLVLQVQNADSKRNETKQNSMHNKGSNLCLNSVLSSPQQQSLRFPHVSTTTLSAALPALQQALLSLTQQAATLLPVPSLVALLARFVTKSQASAAKNIPSQFGATKHFDRRSGLPLSGGFAF